MLNSYLRSDQPSINELPYHTLQRGISFAENRFHAQDTANVPQYIVGQEALDLLMLYYELCELRNSAVEAEAM